MRKLLSTALVVGVFASTSLTPAAFAIDAGTLPSLNNKNNADVTVNGNNMNIEIQGGQGGVGTLNWNSFNVGSDAAVNFEFTAHNQTALNKVNASGGLSQIYGQITNSGCYNCGYDATGKVILLNPNGVIFGEGANVNLNSFTVSTMDGTFDATNNKLNLVKNGTSQEGIVVENGAEIYGDKGVTFASDKVVLYQGSKIATSTVPNVGEYAYGKVKIVTSDGVNFAYYNNGAIKEVSDIAVSGDQMTLAVNGNITSGNIDIRNMSTNANSVLSVKDANLKAVKAVIGNDGNIWLTSGNTTLVEDSTLNAGGNIKVKATNKVSIEKSDLDAKADIAAVSDTNDAVINNTTVDTTANVNVTASKIASIQNTSTVNAKNVNINGGTRGQIVNSTVKATNDVNLKSSGSMVWTTGSNITATNDINAEAENGDVLLTTTTMKAGNNINIKAKNSITSARLQDSTFTADKDVNITSTNDSILLTSTAQFAPKGKLNLNGKKNVEINSKSDLTTKNTNITAGENIFLTSAEGNVTVKDSTKFLAGKKIYIQGAKDVAAENVNFNQIQTNIKAGKNVIVNASGLDKKENGLVAEAGENMTITTNGTLSVSDLRSGKDMTLNANKVIAGLPYTTEQKLPGDNSNRSYIEVGGTFTSNVTTNNYEITQSGDLTNDGNYNQRHHIQYGNEKILLVNKRPVEHNFDTPDLDDIDGATDIDAEQPGNVVDPSEPTIPEQGGNEGGNQGGNEGGNEGGNQGGNEGGDQGGNEGEEGECPDENGPMGDDFVQEDDPTLSNNVSKLLRQAMIVKSLKQ